MEDEAVAVKAAEEGACEKVSAYLDGDMTPVERHQTTRLLCREREARLRLGRYQLIGDAIRGDLPEHLEVGFADRVLQALARKREPDDEERHWSVRELWYWLRHPAPSAALSGAMSVLAIAAWWVYMDSMPDGSVSRMEAAMHEAPMSAEAVAQAQERQRTLHSFLATHAQVAVPPTMLPNAQLVEYVE